MFTRRYRSLAVLSTLALSGALLPLSGASAAHFSKLDLSLTINEPGGSDAGVNDIVSDEAEFVITATNSSGEGPLQDTFLALDLPDGVTYSGVTGTDENGDDVVCTTRDEHPEVLCDVGELTDSVELTVTGDTTGRAASTLTGIAYGTWESFPAVFAIGTAPLADATIELQDTTADNTSGTLSFAVANTSDAATVGSNITVEIRLPDGNPSATAAVAGSDGATCERLDPTAGDNIVCQGIEVTAPTIGGLLTTVPEITVSDLGTDTQDILVEAKGDNTSRAAIAYMADGTVGSTEQHTAATRAPAATTQPVRAGQASIGVVINKGPSEGGTGIDLPATEFTPVGGQVDWSLDDDADTGAVRTEWTEGDVRYEFAADTFRPIKDSRNYFQDGGVNFDTHQHGETFRPNGPDNIPDLWVQWLVYSVGDLTRTNADGSEDVFTDVAMHAMMRQVSAAPADGDEAFQRWSEKGPIPARTDTVEFGGPVPALPQNLNMVDVLFANTPEGATCVENGIAGSDCNTELGEFVRFLTFANIDEATGFNPAGIDLTGSNPFRTVTDRFESLDVATLALTGETQQSAVVSGLDASAKNFATVGNADDERAIASRVVIARSDIFPDALAGSGLANGSGPILFNEGGATASLNEDVRAEIHRVLTRADDRTIYILGGPNAVSEDVRRELQADGYVVRRLAGPTRIETSEQVADEVRELNPAATEQLLVRAYTNDDASPTRAWADSISGGAYAADQTIPVILTTTDQLHPAAARALDPAATTYVIGGEGAVSAAAFNEAPNAERIAGTNRAATSVEVASQLFGRTTAADGDTFVVSPGEQELGWAFGLAASAFSAQNDAPLLLTFDGPDGTQVIPTEVKRYLEGLGYSDTVIGDLAVSSSVINDYLVVELLELLQGGAIA